MTLRTSSDMDINYKNLALHVLLHALYEPDSIKSGNYRWLDSLNYKMWCDAADIPIAVYKTEMIRRGELLTNKKEEINQ